MNLNYEQMISVGIDIASEKIDVCVKYRNPTFEVVIKGQTQFKNTEEGFKSLSDWLTRITKVDCKKVFVMEATGTYHENCCHFLYENYVAVPDSVDVVAIVQPYVAKAYFKSVAPSKTDKIDAKYLSQYGLERLVIAWEPFSPVYFELKIVCRARASCVAECTMHKSQLHAAKAGHNLDILANHHTKSVDRLEECIEKFDEMLVSIAEKDPKLCRKLQFLDSIPGFGLLTAIVVACELNGFHGYKNVRQIVRAAGLDPVRRDSGKKSGKSHISKRGNAHVRSILFNAAKCAAKESSPFYSFYKRIADKNLEAKGKAIVAVMRKILSIGFSVWTKEEMYSKDYQFGAKKTVEAQRDSTNQVKGEKEGPKEGPKEGVESLIKLGKIYSRKRNKNVAKTEGVANEKENHVAIPKKKKTSLDKLVPK